MDTKTDTAYVRYTPRGGENLGIIEYFKKNGDAFEEWRPEAVTGTTRFTLVKHPESSHPSADFQFHAISFWGRDAERTRATNIVRSFVTGTPAGSTAEFMGNSVVENVSVKPKQIQFDITNENLTDETPFGYVSLQATIKLGAQNFLTSVDPDIPVKKESSVP